MIEDSSDNPQKSSIIFDYLYLSSEIFGNLRKFFENVGKHFCGPQTNFWESSEIFEKWSEIFRKSSKINGSSMCIVLFI